MDDEVTIINLLHNSGINVSGMDDGYIYFQDPSCIYPVFDAILNYAWLAILILTAFMLAGWALLYIKNGIKINDVFNNAKTIILIFCVLSVVKPIVNLVYGDDLFSKGCDTKQVSMQSVQELLDMRNQTLKKSDEALLYESFDVVDSGAVFETNSIENESFETSEIQSDYTQPNNIQTNNNQSNTSGTIYQTNVVAVVYDKQNNTVTYITKDGSKIKRSGGSVTWRNNNPGAIIDSKFTRENGAIGSSGKFAIFPDEETGTHAIVKLLRSKKYNNLSIKDAIHRYAPAADNNNPVRYTQRVADLTGLPPDKIMKNLSDTEIRSVVNAICKIEGWNQGREQKI